VTTAVDDPGLRLAAVKSLAVLGDRRTVGPLVDVLVSDDWAELSDAALKGLARIDDELAVDAVAWYYQERLICHEAAREALNVIAVRMMEEGSS
jgi:hypothetical protein